jgi:Putative peptidoglycan binding domain
MTTRVRALIAIALLVAALPAASPAAARTRTPLPRLTGLRCVPATAKGCRAQVQAKIGGQIQLRGRNLYRGMRVTFRWTSGALATTLQRKKTGWVVKIPAGTPPGTVAITVRDRARRRSNARHLRVVRPVIAIPGTPFTGSADLPAAFRGHGMWIWQIPKSEGGDPAAIAAKAQATGIDTVFVKSSDGTAGWPQFNSQLVATLHAQGLRACAWQFVYGKEPAGEAEVGASAVAQGADCLVIDAESDYQGRYAAAQQYMNALRAAVGESYPLGLTSFPYVDLHPRLPYSVFLGPGGAQANMPQVYWKAIGTDVATASARTAVHNRIYRAPMAPLGQAYDNPDPADLQSFRQIWASYGAQGLSWWSWQSSSQTTWATLAQPAPAASAVADPGWPSLAKGSKGDEVIWLQQHLSSADPSVPVNGTFGSETDTALRSFQLAHGLPPSGSTDASTWPALLALPVRAVDWTAPASSGATARAAGARREIPELGRG